MPVLYLLIATLLVVNNPTYFTRTGHVFVQSSNDILDIKAHNYQFSSTLNLETGETAFTGLIKSFEFELGLADRLFSGQRVNVEQHPKMTFTGRVANVTEINAKVPGTYPVRIEGVLEIWGFQRNTEATGQVVVQPDGTLKAHSEFTMRIEEESMEKINSLMRRHLPSVVKVDTDRLGVSRDIAVEVDLTYRRRS